MTDYREVLYRSYRSNFYAHVNPDDSATQQAATEAYDFILGPYLPSDRNLRILDIGCGAGLFVEYLLRRGYALSHGVDTSAEQVEHCKSRGLPVEQGDAIDFLRKNTGWDLVISWDVIEHLTKQEVVDFLSAIYAAIVPGGGIIVGTGNASSIYGPTARYMDFTHETLFTETSLRQVLLACGFTGVEVWDTKAQFGLRPARFARWLGLKVIRTILRAAFILEVGDNAPRLLGKLIGALGRKPGLEICDTKQNGNSAIRS